ncbi:30S ribosomal protein S6 [bacterium M21]|nr:30S ribosomal protein S6 [bacterium M21]
MKKYEAILILDDRKVEGNGTTFVKEFEAVIGELGGTNISSESLGRKQFASPIKKKSAGTYWDLTFDMDEDKVEDLKKRYKLTQQVLRLVVFVYDVPEITVIVKKQEEVEAEA